MVRMANALPLVVNATTLKRFVENVYMTIGLEISCTDMLGTA